ncbi:SirA family protein [Bacillus sp. B-jedd]|nr:SirA family protein [Bacillus sp. B-jedd]
MKVIPILAAGVLLMAACSASDSATEKPKKVESTGGYKSIAKENEGEETPAFKSVPSAEAEKMVAGGGVTVIDVRGPELFAESHLPEAQNIPIKEIEAKSYDLDPNGTYLIVCQKGKTSEKASGLLVENGYPNVINMSGGMDSWTGATEKSK